MSKMLELAERLAKAPDAEAFGLFAYNGRDLIDAALRQCSAVSVKPTAWRVWWVSLNTARTALFEDHDKATAAARENAGCVIPLYATSERTEPQTAPTCQCNNPLVMMKDGREHCGKCGRPAAQCQAESEK
jgi:hypothetical protein